ncbi:MAG: DUF885 family protein [Alphaproteobacteria bacterium]
MLQQQRGFVAKAPAETILVQSLKRRITAVQGIDAAQADKAVADAIKIVTEEVFPAYQHQIGVVAEMQPKAVHDGGIWRLKDGDQYYATALRAYTTTALTPDEIHKMGSDLVASVGAEMDAILKAQGLTKKRGQWPRASPSFPPTRKRSFPSTDKGREELLKSLNEQIVALQPMLREYTCDARPGEARDPARVPPIAGRRAWQLLRVRCARRFPAWLLLHQPARHEGMARTALRPSPITRASPVITGRSRSRRRRASFPSCAARSSAIPAIPRAGGSMPSSSRTKWVSTRIISSGASAFCNRRHSARLRLVCDTGLHHKRWSREQAIDYMLQATGDQKSSVTTEIERYCVWPGQACAYMVGREVIHKVRDDEAALGEIRSQEIPRCGLEERTRSALGLEVENVKRWTSAKLAPTTPAK